MPSEEEMKERQARQARAEGMPIIPTEAMLEMKGQSVSMLWMSAKFVTKSDLIFWNLYSFLILNPPT